MKRWLPLTLLLVLFPTVALADSTGWFFGNTGGTMTFDPTTSTLSLTSTITKIVGVGIHNAQLVETGNLGTITLTTGPLISGSLLHVAVFEGATLTVNVDVGVSSGSGTLIPFTFFGTLNTPLHWWVDKFGHEHLGGAQGGAGSGILYPFGGVFGEGVTIWDFHQVAVSSGTNQYNVIEGGMTIPEPGTMALVGTGIGLLAGAAFVRRQSGVQSWAVSGTPTNHV